jgi:hypothetical protein
MKIAPSSKNQVPRLSKAEVIKKRVSLENTMYERLIVFKKKLMLDWVPAKKVVRLTFPDGIFNRDFEMGEEAVQYFSELSNICKDIAKIRQELKLLYLQEDISKE